MPFRKRPPKSLGLRPWAGLRPYLRNLPASLLIPLQAKMFLPCICTPSFAQCGFIPLRGKRATPEGAHFGNHVQRKTLGAWEHVLACVLPIRRPHGVNTAVFRYHEHRLGQRARGNCGQFMFLSASAVPAD